MSDIAIRVEGLGKCYSIGSAKDRNKTFREMLNEAALKPFRAARSFASGPGHKKGRSEDIIWALRDISFEVKRGDGRRDKRGSHGFVRESQYDGGAESMPESALVG